MAVAHRRPAPGVVHPTDRDSQYAATQPTARARRARPDGQHESARELLGQCRGGKLLSCADNTTRASSALSGPRRSQAGHFRRDRSMLQRESAGTRPSAIAPPPSSKPSRRTLGRSQPVQRPHRTPRLYMSVPRRTCPAWHDSQRMCSVTQAGNFPTRKVLFT